MESFGSEKNITTLTHAAHMAEIMARHFGEEITLRELRVRFKLFCKYAHDPQAELTYGDVAKETGVPSATISRYLLFCLMDGCLNERIDPEDRRRRLLSLAPPGAERMLSFLRDARKNGFV